MHFPDQYFVGKQSYIGKGDKFPLGFPTPEGKDSPAKKRKQTVIDWSGKDGKQEIIDNVPVEGFRFVGDVKRSGGWFSNGNVVWRVEDPRGFEFEITSPNLAMMLELTTIENGVIKGKCLYARDGAKNALLVENSTEYQQALEQTKRIKSSEKFTLKSLQPGDLVQMVDGTEAYYYGKIYCLVEVKSEYYVDHNGAITSSRDYYSHRGNPHSKTEFVVKERYLLISGNHIELPSTPKIASLKKAAGKSLIEAMAQVNKDCPYVSISGASYSGGRVVYASKTKFTEKDATLKTVEVKNVFETDNATVETQKYIDGKYVMEKKDITLIKRSDLYKDSFIVMEKDGKLFKPNSISSYYIYGHQPSNGPKHLVLAIDRQHPGCDTNGFYPVESLNGTTLDFKQSSAILTNKVKTPTYPTYNRGVMEKDPAVFFYELSTVLKNAKFFTYQLEIQGTIVPAFASVSN